MSTFISEPGTRLGGRYRLEDRVSASSGWAAWKAIDETLARPVTVLTFARGFPRIGDAVTAARAASRLTDARLAQVFDVEEDWDHAYVVMEWVAGDSLEDLLADGPLDPGLGAEIVAQGAEALAVAHAAGVAHLCLNPDSLRWTSGGVKIVGLGIDAALSGITADDPALADTQGLAKLLYAALTAHWPGGEWPSLPPAPEVDGHPCSPRQVRAGVPAGIDDVTCRVLFQRAPDGSPSVTTPAMLATALSRVIPAPAVPPAAPRHGGYATGTGALLAPGPPYAEYGVPPRRAGRSRDAMPGRGPGSGRVLATIAGIGALGALGAGVWALGHRHSGSAPPARPTHSASQSAVPVSVLGPRSATAFGPNGGDNGSLANLAIDKQPGTSWTTDSYRGSPRFGNLYGGTGLMLDMGRRVNVSSVTVTFGNVPGTHVRIEVGSNAAGAGSAPPPGFTTLDRSANAADRVTFTGHGTTSGEFVLIWFTKLAPQSGQSGHYQADVYNVVVRGSS